MVVRNRIDDELAEVEFGRQAAESCGDFVGCADEVAGPLVVFRGVEGVGGEAEDGVRGCGAFVELVHADAALEEADRGVQASGFGEPRDNGQVLHSPSALVPHGNGGAR